MTSKDLCSHFNSSGSGFSFIGFSNHEWPWLGAYTRELNGRMYHLYFYLNKNRKSIAMHLDEIQVRKNGGYITYDRKGTTSKAGIGAVLRYENETTTYYEPIMGLNGQVGQRAGRMASRNRLVRYLSKKNIVKGVKECLVTRTEEWKGKVYTHDIYGFPLLDLDASRDLFLKNFEPQLFSWAEEIFLDILQVPAMTEPRWDISQSTAGKLFGGDSKPIVGPSGNVLLHNLTRPQKNHIFGYP